MHLQSALAKIVMLLFWTKHSSVGSSRTKTLVFSSSIPWQKHLGFLLVSLSTINSFLDISMSLLSLFFFLLPFSLSLILSFYHGSILLHFSSLIPFLCLIFISHVCVCVLGQVGPSVRTSLNRSVIQSVNKSVSYLDSHRVSQSVNR